MPFARLYNQLQSQALYTGAVFSILLIFVIPFSTALTTLFSFLIFLIWLLSGQFMQLPVLLKRNPTALFAFALFTALTLAIFYSPVPVQEGLSGLKKYHELLLLVVLLGFLDQENFYRWGFYALFLSLLITLISSYAIYFDFLPAPESARASPSLKMRITHSLFMAFLAFYCAHQLIDNPAWRRFWIVLFLLSTCNLFFMIDGRTGQLLYFLLSFLFSYQRLSKFKAAAFIGFNILFFIFFLNFSSGGQRIHEGIANSRSYLQGHTETHSSMGQRLTFWKHSIELIAEKPLLGHGTGSFASQYARVAAADDIKTSNAHNEFLMLGVQTGLLGILLFLGLLFSYYRQQKLLAAKQQWFAQGVLLTFTLNSLLNSTLLDHAEGHWFACLIALSLAPLTSTQAAEKPTQSC